MSKIGWSVLSITIVGTTAGLLVVLLIFGVRYFVPSFVLMRETEIALRDSEYKLMKIGMLTENVLREVEALRVSVVEAEPLAAQAAIIEQNSSRIGTLESGLKQLRELIFENPEVVITIPHVKKDIEYLRKDNNTLREELERMVGFTTWLFGIFITISGGILGMNIVVLLKK